MAKIFQQAVFLTGHRSDPEVVNLQQPFQSEHLEAATKTASSSRILGAPSGVSNNYNNHEKKVYIS